MSDASMGAAPAGEPLLENEARVGAPAAVLQTGELAESARQAAQRWIVAQRAVGSAYLDGVRERSAKIMAQAARAARVPAGSAPEDIPLLVRHERLFASVSKEVHGAL